jgi:hypothetical protein
MFIVERHLQGNSVHPAQWIEIESEEIERAATSAEAEAAAIREINSGKHGVVKTIRVLSWVNERRV